MNHIKSHTSVAQKSDHFLVGVWHHVRIAENKPHKETTKVIF